MNYMRIMVLYKNTLGSVKLLIADIYIERSPGILVLYNCLSNNSALILSKIAVHYIGIGGTI